MDTVKLPFEKCQVLLNNIGCDEDGFMAGWHLIKENPLSNDKKFNEKICWIRIFFSTDDESGDHPVLVIARVDSKDKLPYNFDIYPLLIYDDGTISRLKKPYKLFSWHWYKDSELDGFFKQIPEEVFYFMYE